MTIWRKKRFMYTLPVNLFRKVSRNMLSVAEVALRKLKMAELNVINLEFIDEMINF